MKRISRRTLITTGVSAAAGIAGLAAADRLAARYGLIPPDSSGFYGAGETLTYATQRLLTRYSLAREFSRSVISKPFMNAIDPLNDAFKKQQADGFKGWRLMIDGLVERPTAFSISDLKSFPIKSQITEVACEEGWSYIAVWIGTRLHEVLREVGLKPRARYLVYISYQPDWWDSLDMADALHPQTFLTMGMNDGDLPVGFGGPLRMRVPRQLGYKNIKFLTHITATDDIKKFGQGLGSASPEGGYSWYAGI